MHHCAPPTTLRSYHRYARWIRAICGASQRMIENGCQSRPCLLERDIWPQVVECIGSAAMQYFGTTAAMMESTCQRSTAAAFTAWPAFCGYDCCDPYGGVDSSIVEAAQGVLIRDFSLGQIPPRAPRPLSSRADFAGIWRCAAAPEARTQRSSCPATPRSRAYEHPPQLKWARLKPRRQGRLP